MKRLAASLALAVALSLLPAQAASADTLDLTAGVFPDDQLAALSSTGHGFAVGGGTTATGTHFAFSAHCKDAINGCSPGLGQTAPSGYAIVRDPALGEAQGHVCAMDVQASPLADFWIDVEKGSGTLGSYPTLFFVVTDGGQPPSGADEFGVGVSSGCPAMDIAVPDVVTQGNIVVK